MKTIGHKKNIRWVKEKCPFHATSHYVMKYLNTRDNIEYSTCQGNFSKEEMDIYYKTVGVK